MWMMGYNDAQDLNFPSDNSFNSRKLRPLIPRPLSSSSSSSHTNDFFSQFHHMATSVADQSKRELNNVLSPSSSPPVVVSSRWNPTPEQLRVLEELYRRGTRTPSADQIQHITSQLRRYGKIEGKNVFYWFQNHKARERQKRRRQMESSAITTADHSARDLDVLERKDSGSGRTVYEEQTKNWVPSTNCSTLPEESVPIQGAAKGNVMGATDCRTENGWIQFEELHQIRNNNTNTNNFAEKDTNNIIIINNNNNNNINNPPSLQLLHCFPATTALRGGSQLMMNIAPITTTATVTTIMHPKCHRRSNNINVISGNFDVIGVEEELEDEEEEEECGESETLQLFPLCSDRRNGGEIIGGKNNNGCETVENSGMNSTNLTPLQFFEFLPLKN
ncbi:hypothetical protein IC582_029879 [Cucumis melo]|uniref:WUSCHEL-related homeobox 1-like n=1 Tax=Cucumis melo TaxID=3656 RepID=A0A1S4DS26_CUCME|nr:WUSCHEL-related homeobox 1-like [Cucumis melo]